MMSPYRSSTYASNAGASTVSVSDRTMTTSSTLLGPRSRSSSSVSARFDSGLLMKANSMVRASLRNMNARARETTRIAAQTEITFQGRRALHRARPSVERPKPVEAMYLSGLALNSASQPEQQR